MQTGLKQLGEDTNENFFFLINELNELLKLSLSSKELEDFNLYDYTKLSHILNLIKKSNNNNLKNFYLKMINNGRLFQLFPKRSYYCSNYSINRLTFLAGIHLHSIYYETNQTNSLNIFDSQDQVKKYLYFFHQNLVAYLSSKTFNPFRKCNMYLNYKDIKKENRESSTKTTLSLLEQHHLKNFKMKDLLKGLRVYELYETSYKVGKIIGENIYNHYYLKRKSHIDLTDLIMNPCCELSSYKLLITKIMEQTNLLEQKKRFF